MSFDWPSDIWLQRNAVTSWGHTEVGKVPSLMASKDYCHLRAATARSTAREGGHRHKRAVSAV